MSKGQDRWASDAPPEVLVEVFLVEDSLVFVFVYLNALVLTRMNKRNQYMNIS